jgi:hypothetical protein
VSCKTRLVMMRSLIFVVAPWKRESLQTVLQTLSIGWQGIHHCMYAYL